MPTTSGSARSRCSVTERGAVSLPEGLPRAQTETLLYESDWLASRPFFYNVRTGRASHTSTRSSTSPTSSSTPRASTTTSTSASASSSARRCATCACCATRRACFGPRGTARRVPGGSRLGVARAGEHRRRGARVGQRQDQRGRGRRRRDRRAHQRRLRLAAHQRAAHRPQAHPRLQLRHQRRPGASFEVVKAAELARRLGIRWELVPLGDFHRYFDDWDALFGVSTHAHGMYHIEFYATSSSAWRRGALVLSGACGDRFAGVDRVRRSSRTLATRRRLRGVPLPQHECRLPLSAASAARSSGACSCLRPRRASARRCCRGCSPCAASASPCSPTCSPSRPRSACAPRDRILDIDLAMRMLTLPAEQRKDRRWQREFFARQGVDLEARAFSLRRAQHAELPGHAQGAAEAARRRAAARGREAGVRALDQPQRRTFRALLRGDVEARRMRGFRRAVEALERRTGVSNVVCMPTARTSR